MLRYKVESSSSGAAPFDTRVFSMARERRKCVRRYPQRLQATLSTLDRSYQSRLLDESPDGLGVFLTSPAELAVGQTIDVCLMNNEPRPAVICHVGVHPQGGLLVGLRWCGRASISAAEE